jgi:hypothetical protein
MELGDISTIMAVAVLLSVFSFGTNFALLVVALRMNRWGFCFGIPVSPEDANQYYDTLAFSCPPDARVSACVSGSDRSRLDSGWPFHKLRGYP